MIDRCIELKKGKKTVDEIYARLLRETSGYVPAKSTLTKWLRKEGFGGRSRPGGPKRGETRGSYKERKFSRNDPGDSVVKTINVAIPVDELVIDGVNLDEVLDTVAELLRLLIRRTAAAMREGRYSANVKDKQ